MKKEVIISGFGGQGVMSMGKFLAEAGLAEGLDVTWVPSYGPEMRGGTANCSIVLSDRTIGTPLVNFPTEVIAMNKPSLLKYECVVAVGGTIFINGSVAEYIPRRNDIYAIYVPCKEIANELGNGKIANMAMLGAYIEATKILKADSIWEALVNMFSGPQAKLAELNMEALRRGAAYVH